MHYIADELKKHGMEIWNWRLYEALEKLYRIFSWKRFPPSIAWQYLNC